MISMQQPSTKQSILIFLRKQGAATAQSLADHLQITPQAIRRHLKDLEEEELISHRAATVGMGRPQHQYFLSSRGEAQFPAAYDEFAVDLLTTLADTVGPDQMGSILQRQWERKAEDYRRKLGTGSLEERVAMLVDLRREEGYMAEYYPITPPDSHYPQFMLTEHHCAIAQVAHSFPSVCGHELEMFAFALSDCTVERINWQVDGEHACGYLISAHPDPDASAAQT
jgi:DeoR family suf operon transcriptional repressor